MEYLRQTFSNPSGLDSMDNYAGGVPEADLLVLMTRTRDSDLLTESNWEVALERLGGEDGEDVVIHRFGHWACGWWEALCVREGGPKESKARDMHESLAAYPVLNEDHFSDKEREAADETWESDYSPEERVAFLREHGTEGFSTFGQLLTNVREGTWAPFTNDGYYPLIG